MVPLFLLHTQCWDRRFRQAFASQLAPPSRPDRSCAPLRPPLGFLAEHVSSQWDGCEHSARSETRDEDGLLHWYWGRCPRRSTHRADIVECHFEPGWIAVLVDSVCRGQRVRMVQKTLRFASRIEPGPECLRGLRAFVGWRPCEHCS